MRSVLALSALLLWLTACSAPAGGGAAAPAGSPAGKTYRIGMVQQNTHPALDAARKGAEDALRESGLAVEIDAKNAQNDAATLAAITDGFRDAKVDLVIAIGTQPLQAAYKSLQGSGIPIVFNTVTDPYAAGVAKSPTDHPGVTGIQALAPLQQAIDLILEFNPQTRRIGNIWTSNEKNSEVATRIAREYAQSKGLEFIERQVTRADEVLQAAESLAAEGVDALFIATDSTVVATLEAVVKVANENDIGLYCSDPSSAERGCVFGLGLDYYDNGYVSAKEMAIPILQGTDVSSIPIRKQEKNILVLNTAAAREQNVTIPDGITSRADRVVDAITPKQQ